MADTVCKSKSAAMSALATIADSMGAGVQKDVLKAIMRWIDETVNDVQLPEQIEARLRKIFEGTEEEQNGKAWIDEEQADPAYVPGWPHKMIHEPKHRAQLSCQWDAKTKAWQPCYSWPPVLQKQEYKPAEEEG